mmetsp:Transcript_3640/g.5461  ORF Transcript_3640/g.5461 Transcript_3640/m.5461 type:complete len:629 (-) Transcript_3640:102-1988(-)
MLRFGNIKSYLRSNHGFLLKTRQLEKSLLTCASSSRSNDQLIASSVEYRTRHQIVIKSNSSNLSFEELLQYLPVATFDTLTQSLFDPVLLKPLLKEGFTEPTPIQAQSWPVIQAKKDLISVARTGSGKTIGYLLPAFQRVLTSKLTTMPNTSNRGKFRSPKVLILAPTRELAVQIEEEAKKFCRGSDIRTAVLCGGASRQPQTRALKDGVDVAIATPGRCTDLFEMGVLDLSKIEYVVLDEADRMLDMGFEPQIREIVAQLPSQASNGRQTVFFTATWPQSVQSLAGAFVTNPVQINIGDSSSLNANKAITQHVSVLKHFAKEEELLRILEENLVDGSIKETSKMRKAIVFVSRRIDCDDLAHMLRGQGFPVDSLHGERTQFARSKALEDFRSGRVKLLVATDVAGRGLDVKDVDFVINYDFPMSGTNSVEDYVHRIGRTARGGNTGTAFTFMTSNDLKNGAVVKELVGVLTRCNQVIPEELAEIAHQLENKSHVRSSNSRYGGSSSGSSSRYGGNSSSRFGGSSSRSGDSYGGRYGNQGYEKDNRRRNDSKDSFSLTRSSSRDFDGGGLWKTKNSSSTGSASGFSGKRSSWVDKYFNEPDGDEAESRRIGSSNFGTKRGANDRKYSF